MEIAKTTRISFHFHPYNPENKMHLVEKDESGRKRRYMKGISSGPRHDAHGERMTPNCIKGFMDQANSGEILLFADTHGVRSTDDIGKLVHAEISPEGDWMTEYRLYDELDGVGPMTLERADKLWRQSNGMPPYTKPRQKGFSVEGYIPENGIVQMSNDGKRVIDSVELDGVVVVPRPAYKDSIAHAVFKALGETPPWVQRNSLSAKLREKVEFDEVRESYYRQKSLVFDNLDESIVEIMGDENQDKAERLKILFEEFESLMIDLILKSPVVFQDDENDSPNAPNAIGIYKATVSKGELISELRRNVRLLEKSIKRRTH